MMTEYVRPPAVAGQFYSGTTEELIEEIEGCYRHRLGPGKLPEVNEAGPRQIVGLVSPHAGYMYSGPPAACPVLSDATTELEYEHSLEVQLPFLQHLYGETLRFVPIMMLDQDWETARDIGAAIAQVCPEQDVVIVASTDMTHQEPAQLAREQDMLLVRHIEQLDGEGMLRARARHGITMCGYGPTAAMLVAAQALGAQQGELVTYSNSGDVQPMPTVVGYVSLKVVR